MNKQDMLALEPGDLIRLRNRRRDAQDEEATIVEVVVTGVTYKPGGDRFVRRTVTVDGFACVLRPGFELGQADGTAVVARDWKAIYAHHDTWNEEDASTALVSAHTSLDVLELWTPEREAGFMENRRRLYAEREAEREAARERRAHAAEERAAAAVTCGEPALLPGYCEPVGSGP